MFVLSSVASHAGERGLRLHGTSSRIAAENLQHTLAELQRSVPLRGLPPQQLHDGSSEPSKLLHILWGYAALLPRQRMLL
jgi:hypothetical protein